MLVFDGENWDISLQDKKIVIKCCAKELPDIETTDGYAKELLDVVNSMNSFSIYFTSSVADEKVAYGVMGKTYISTVETYMPWINTVYELDGYYKSLVDLYVIWKSRDMNEKLQDKIKGLNEELKKTETSNTSPIGV